MSLVYFTSGIITAITLVILGQLYLYKRWKKQKTKLIDNHTRFISLVENTKDSLYYYQVYPTEKFLYLSPSTDNVLGEGSVEDGYINPDICYANVHPDDYEILHKKLTGKMDYSRSIIQRWKDKEGKYRWFEEYATPAYKNGVLVAIQGVMRNIDEKVELQEKLHYQLYHDILTGIYNRGHFELTLAKYNEEINVPTAIIVCDLDELKYVNDTYGHKMGDVLIQETARILNKFTSENVTVSRIGGDEFVLIVADKTEYQIKQLVTNILKEIDNYNITHSKEIIKMSVGYSYAQSSIGNMTELFSKADKNMYIDKTKRKKSLVKIFN